jgi:MFS family permease
MYVASALGCAFCWNLESFYVFRFIGGLAIGASSVLAPVYISEIAPADRRGALTGLFQFNIVFGILLAYISNFVVQEMGRRRPVAPEVRHRRGTGDPLCRC